MHREYHKWYSPALGREMELLVFGHAGTRCLVFPTRVGRFFDYENFGILDGTRDAIEAGHLRMICLDSIDGESLYCNWCRPADRIRRHLEYEAYVLTEVMPFSQERNPHAPLIAHGCSLGAYHAVNLAFRHPERFVKVVALSGRYDLTVPVEDFGGLFDGYFDERIYFNMPSQYLPNLMDERTLAELRRLHIVLVIGREDPFLANNQHLSDQLWLKGVAHEFHIWEGRAHRPVRWLEMVRLYL